MKKITGIILTLIMALTLALGISACSNTPDGELRERATVTIFSTNDIHGNALNSASSIGFVKAAEINSSTQNSILVDAGDATQGASFASVSHGADVISAMNAAGYDLMAAGNHEFDYGADTLKSNAELAKFPILAANVKKDDSPLLESSTVIVRADYKIGFIGLTTVSTATSTNPSLLSGITFEDEVATAKAEIAKLKDTTDAIVLVCHLGDNKDAVSCTSEKLIEALDSEEWNCVAAVIDGHSHTIENTFVSGIPVVQTGVNFANLGKITIDFSDSNDGANFKAHGDVISYADAMSYPVNAAGTAKGAEVTSVLSDISKEQAKILEEELCTVKTPLFGGYICYDYAEPRVVETSFGDFVTDAFRHYAEVFAENEKLNLPVIAVENGGGISASLPSAFGKGEKVTKGDVLNAFNHGNLVEVLKVSPAELFAAIESGLAVTGQDDTGLLLRTRVSGSFLQCSGFTYTYDPAGASGNKVVEVKLANGTVLSRTDEENKLLLATNNYVSSSFKKGEKLGELGGEDIIIEDYILLQSGESGVLDYAFTPNLILISGDKSPENYTVTLKVVRGENGVGGTYHLSIDGKAATEVVADADGNITVTLTKGSHYLKLEEGINFVNVNNYSGTGTVNTKPGYFDFSFHLPD